MIAGLAGVTHRRERLVTFIAVAAISSLAWAYTYSLAIEMADMPMTMATSPNVAAWAPRDLVLTFIMWAVMMVAMMIPSASPMVLAFTRVSRQRQGTSATVAGGLFLLGYLLIWTGFSALATLLQWALHATALLSPALVVTSPFLGGGLLLAAGLFQFTPLKQVCLAHCRTPLGFLLTEWRDGKGGALKMGVRHGRYCLGCCWFLMALLFVAGVMNLLWVAAIAVLVLVEKVVPSGDWAGRAAGLLLSGWGLYVLARAVWIVL